MAFLGELKSGFSDFHSQLTNDAKATLDEKRERRAREEAANETLRAAGAGPSSSEASETPRAPPHNEQTSLQPATPQAKTPERAALVQLGAPAAAATSLPSAQELTEVAEQAVLRAEAAESARIRAERELSAAQAELIALRRQHTQQAASLVKVQETAAHYEQELAVLQRQALDARKPIDHAAEIEKVMNGPAADGQELPPLEQADQAVKRLLAYLQNSAGARAAFVAQMAILYLYLLAHTVAPV